LLVAFCLITLVIKALTGCSLATTTSFYTAALGGKRMVKKDFVSKREMVFDS